MKTPYFVETRKNRNKDYLYLFLLLSHILLGIIIYLFPIVSKSYAFLILLLGTYFIIKNKNKNNEVLYVVSYLVGSEVFLRTTGGNPNYEFVKYSMFISLILGIFYSGISKKAYLYWVFLILLIPSILLAINTIDSDIRVKIVFDISGPICLGVCALYTYKKKITTSEINAIFLSMGLPILACCAYLLLQCPLTDFDITSTESNYLLSGGYAPNQMATILGVGMFVFFLRLILISTSKTILILNIIIASYIYYRGLLTFSRGGLITGIAIVVVLLFSLLINSKNYTQIKQKTGLTFVALLAIFMLTSYQTDGLLLKRYTDKNPSGLDKSDEKNGRRDMALEEIKLFKENPMLGIGVGEGKEVRKSEYGAMICSHNEITRMLAEHGSLGMLSLLILFISPLLLFLKNKRNIYLLSLFAFWLLTINHSGMRIAAPAFIYGLALLDIQFDEPDEKIAA